MKIKMIYLPVEGEPEIVEIERDWQVLAKKIGAEFIERVRVGHNLSMIVDESGLYTHKNPNPVAGFLYGTPRHKAPIIGPALLGYEGFVEDGVDWIDFPEEALNDTFQEVLRIHKEDV